jgi:hypothetical protein
MLSTRGIPALPEFSSKQPATGPCGILRSSLLLCSVQDSGRERFDFHNLPAGASATVMIYKEAKQEC